VANDRKRYRQEGIETMHLIDGNRQVPVSFGLVVVSFGLVVMSVRMIQLI